MMAPITVSSGSYTAERKAEIQAKAREVSAAAARFHDLLPLCVEGDEALQQAHQELAIAQNQLSMVLTMAGMDALLKSIEEQETPGEPRRPWYRRLISPRRPSRVEPANQKDPAGAE